MQSRERLHELDVLKGILIFAIVLYHMPEHMRGFIRVFGVFYLYGGDVGNTVFFALSGFSICYAYLNRVQDLELWSFILKRIQKIYPLYLITEIVSLYFVVKNNGISVLNIKDIVLNLTMTTSGWVEDIYPYNVPTWFFSVLLIDYIVWFLITKYANEKKWYIFFGMILLGLSIQKICLEKPFMYYHTGEAIVPFFEGCFLYKLWTLREQQNRNLFLFIGITGFLTGLCIFLTCLTDFNTAAGSWKYVWYSAFCPLIIMSTLTVKAITKTFQLRAFRVIFGNISRQVFFWHYPLFGLFEHMLRNVFPESKNMRCIVYIIVLYLLCVTYREVEQVIRKRKQRGQKCSLKIV